MRALVVAGLLGGLLCTAPVQAAEAETCMGKPATIVGTGLVDGTNGDDVIIAKGRSGVWAGDGDDTICVVGWLRGWGEITGFSEVNGEGGTDTLEVRGSSKDDRFQYEQVESADVRLRGGDDDLGVTLYDIPETQGVFDGGAGSDQLDVYSSWVLDLDLADRLMDVDGGAGTYGVKGFEEVGASAPTLVLAGDERQNRLEGYACDLTIAGGGGADRLGAGHRVGESCSVLVRGGKGDDHVVGTSGNDKLLGGPGDDYLVGALGNDRLMGGPGRDRANGKIGRDTCVAEIEKACEA